VPVLRYVLLDKIVYMRCNIRILFAGYLYPSDVLGSALSSICVVFLRYFMIVC